MAKTKDSADLGAKYLPELQVFSALLVNGSMLDCKLLEFGDPDILVETDHGRLLIPKASVLYYVLPTKAKEPKKADKETVKEKSPPAPVAIATKKLPTTLPLKEIIIPGNYRSNPPDQGKIDNFIAIYKKKGTFPKPIEVKAFEGGWYLVDGLTRYAAAEQLGLVEVSVKVKYTER